MNFKTGIGLIIFLFAFKFGIWISEPKHIHYAISEWQEENIPEMTEKEIEELPIMFMEFDTVIFVLKMEKSDMGYWEYWFDYEEIKQFDPSKLIKTNIPQWIKMNCGEEQCVFKIYDTI